MVNKQFAWKTIRITNVYSFPGNFYILLFFQQIIEESVEVFIQSLH